MQASSVVEEDKVLEAGPGTAGQQAAEKLRYTGISRSTTGSLALDKDVFWFAAQSKDRFKWNMLSSLPLLRQVMRCDC